MTALVKTWARAGTLLVVALLVNGCYLPVLFDAEIEISRYGAYSMIYEGYMVDVQFYDKLRKGKMTPEEEAAKVELIRTDLTRDSSVKSFAYFKRGRFQVKWQKRGDILLAKMVTFVRRNENILSILYNKRTKLITIQSTPIAKEQAKKLIAMGLNMQGQLRLKTDARVGSHNAQKVVKEKATGRRIYVWDIKSLLDPSPKLGIVIR